MRPRTLSEVAALVAQGHSFNLALFEFLDEFYEAPNASSLESEPQRLASALLETGPVIDCYLAAVAEDLGQRFNLPTPQWAGAEDRKLRRPWFASSLASLRAVLIRESPPAFRSRNLFVSENALSRA